MRVRNLSSSIKRNYEKNTEGLNGVKRVAWNIQKINRVSWKREKINRVSWIIFVQITVLFVEGLNGVKRVAWNIQKINRVPCLLHPHWDPQYCEQLASRFLDRLASEN